MRINQINDIETKHYCSFILCASVKFLNNDKTEKLKSERAKERIIVHYIRRNIIEVTCSD